MVLGGFGGFLHDFRWFWVVLGSFGEFFGSFGFLGGFRRFWVAFRWLLSDKNIGPHLEKSQ